MHFMCWDMEIEHRNDDWLTDADYFSRLGANLCYDPLLYDYIEQVNALRQKNPSPSKLPMEPENMPYFRGPRVNTPSHYAATLDPPADASKKHPSALQILYAAQSPKCGLQHLSNWPVSFGLFTSAACTTATGTRSLYNSDLTAAASMLARFDWAIYGFNSGHFVSSVMERGIQINVVLSSDPFANRRALFKQFTKCPTILSSALALLDHVRGSGITSKLTGYMIHSHPYTTSKPTTCFWDIQASIVTQLWLIRLLSIVLAFVHPDHDSRAVSNGFLQCLRKDGWVCSDTVVSYPDFGDSVSGSCHLIAAVHSNTKPSCKPIEFKTPPPTPLRWIGRFLWAPFNRP